MPDDFCPFGCGAPLVPRSLCASRCYAGPRWTCGTRHYGIDEQPIQSRGCKLRARVRELENLVAANAFAWSAIAKDQNLRCRCGRGPYTDGETCPKCTAILWHDTLWKALSKYDIAIKKGGDAKAT